MGTPTFQERYKDRMSVLERMKNETHYLITLVKQLAPFIHNYKAVSAKIHPKLSDSSGGLNNMTQVSTDFPKTYSFLSWI